MKVGERLINVSIEIAGKPSACSEKAGAHEKLSRGALEPCAAHKEEYTTIHLPILRCTAQDSPRLRSPPTSVDAQVQGRQRLHMALSAS